jgi:hypothetical protein
MDKVIYIFVEIVWQYMIQAAIALDFEATYTIQFA